MRLCSVYVIKRHATALIDAIGEGGALNEAEAVRQQLARENAELDLLIDMVRRRILSFVVVVVGVCCLLRFIRSVEFALTFGCVLSPNSNAMHTRRCRSTSMRSNTR